MKQWLKRLIGIILLIPCLFLDVTLYIVLIGTKDTDITGALWKFAGFKEITVGGL